MAKIFSIASGKGGVGKSTISCHLAKSMANYGEKTIVIETDCGLRGLDIILGIDQIVFDIGDIILGNCELFDAIQTVENFENLHFLPASTNFKQNLTQKDLFEICKPLRDIYDNIIFDLPSGYAVALETKDISDMFLIVVTPDPVCIRDASMFVDFLRNDCKISAEMRLIVNKMTPNALKKGFVENIDYVIDQTNLQLLGIIPDSSAIMISNFLGKHLKKQDLTHKIFNAIHDRLIGKNKKNINIGKLGKNLLFGGMILWLLL